MRNSQGKRLFLFNGLMSHWNRSDSKSAAGVRTAWLTNHCRAVLTTWRAMFGSDFTPHVFPSTRIPARHMTDYKSAWRKAAAAACLKDRRIYDLRSTFASTANSCRASGLTVAHLLGHADTQILATYVRPIDDNTKAVIDALEAARNAHTSKASSIQ